MATSLIVRADAQTHKPIAFIADTLDKGQMLAWSGNSGEPEIVGIDSYQSTNPVDPATAKEVANRYARKFGEDEVHLRQRLPRKGVELRQTKAYQLPKATLPVKKNKPGPKPQPKPRVNIDLLATQIARLLAKAM